MSENKYPIGGYAPGNYQHKCCTCGQPFTGDKRAVECEPCAIKGKEQFDSLPDWKQNEIRERNVRIANYMFSGQRTPERELIYRIVEQWGNAVEMPNMEGWLRDYAAVKQTGAVWVKAKTFTYEEGVSYYYKFKYLGELNKGVGRFDKNGFFRLYPSNGIPPVGLDNVFILDESGTPAAGGGKMRYC